MFYCLNQEYQLDSYKIHFVQVKENIYCDMYILFSHLYNFNLQRTTIFHTQTYSMNQLINSSWPTNLLPWVFCFCGPVPVHLAF